MAHCLAFFVVYGRQGHSGTAEREANSLPYEDAQSAGGASHLLRRCTECGRSKPLPYRM